jgi:hypothetical protein
MKQDHLHPPSVSTTPLRICGTPIRLHRHRRAFTAHPLCLHDIAAYLRLTHFVSTTTTHSVSTTSPRFCGTHRFAPVTTYFVSPTPPRICGPPICPTDIAAHLRLIHFVFMTSPRICGPPICLHDIAAHLRHTILSLRHPPICLTNIAAHLWLTHFVSTTTHFVSPTSPRICGPSIVSTTSPRPFGPPICLTDIAAYLRHIHFVSTTSPRIYGSPTSSLRHRRILAVLYFVSTTTSTHFVSPTLPCTCGSPIVSPTPRICGSFYLVFTTSPPITVLLLSTFRASLAREGVSDYS